MTFPRIEFYMELSICFYAVSAAVAMIIAKTDSNIHSCPTSCLLAESYSTLGLVYRNPFLENMLGKVFVPLLHPTSPKPTPTPRTCSSTLANAHNCRNYMN